MLNELDRVGLKRKTSIVVWVLLLLNTQMFKTRTLIQRLQNCAQAKIDNNFLYNFCKSKPFSTKVYISRALKKNYSHLKVQAQS